MSIFNGAEQQPGHILRQRRRIPIYFLGYKHFIVSAATATVKYYLFLLEL